MSLNLMVLKIGLGILMTIQFGIIGTALSSVMAHGINWILYLRRIGTHMQLPWYQVLPFPSYLKILGVASVVAAFIWVLKTYVFALTGVFALVVSLLLYLALFIMAGRLTGIISSKDLAFLRDWFRLKFLFS